MFFLRKIYKDMISEEAYSNHIKKLNKITNKHG